jgi:hypothetical protein
MKLSDHWIIAEKEKKLISSLVSKGKAEQERNKKFAIIDFERFYKLFTDDEIAVMKKYLAIDPKKIDYKLPFIGFDDKPNDLVPIPNQEYAINNEVKILPCQYLPQQTFNAYIKLNDAMNIDIKKKLLVLYGYRSPARQVFIFFDILERHYNFDLDKTLRRVCFPDYSEHVCIKRQAIDFMTTDNGKSEDFEKNEEYDWLQKNAAKFGFYESYPKDNELDMMYEPWHWHYEK